jgi:hypothetical protein
MIATRSPYRSDVQAGRAGFAQLLRAEWTKFRTVRGWIVGLVVAASVTVLVGLLPASSSQTACGDGPALDNDACSAPIGPDGEPVSDAFYFVHQPLEGDGSITVRVTSLTGRVPSNSPAQDSPAQDGAQAGGGSGELGSEVMPWAKAGLIVKESTEQGASYTAVMVTGEHGVRMQHDFVHDTAGTSGAVSADSPRWLRLTRSDDMLTGEESADGRRWTRVGTARLPELPSTVQVGLFVASPQATEVNRELFGLNATGGPTQATGAFDHLELRNGARSEGAWTGANVGSDPVTSSLGGYEQTGGTFTVRGSGDIAPAVDGQIGAHRAVEQSLVGTFAGLIAVIVVGTLFMTAEYRRGMVRTTLVARPERGRVLAAKATVIGAITFVLGLAAASTAIGIGQRIARANGEELNPVDALTEMRVVIGTAALLAVAAVLALAVGTMLRRSAGAVTAVLGAIVVPYILATGSVLPEGPSEWLLRLTPAAAFSVQQTLVEYPHVTNLYAPANGYFPLSPWAGFAVLCGYTAAALTAATILLHQRDA